MRIYVEPTEATLPILTAAKQLVMNGTVPSAEVVKYITITKRIIINITEVNANIVETWSFENSAVHLPTVTEDAQTAS